MSLKDILLGRILPTRAETTRKIGVIEAVPAMGLDGLASSAYGPEAALAILMPLGVAGLRYLPEIMAVILALLAILHVSYRQIIRAYPNNGGAYTVAKRNLGANGGLLAATALMIDYVLNVAVGISAGIAALVSAFPALHPHTLDLCLFALMVLTLANLRGTVDAGRLFAAPTYLFIASFALLLGLGAWKTLSAGGHPHPLVPPPPVSHAAATASLWLLVRSFAAGCTAMTGVEAVSNGVGDLREPVIRRGHQTLLLIVGVLALLLAGITFLTPAYDIAAMDQTQPGYRSVLSQIAAAVVGYGAFYYVAMGSLLCVLVLSANTSFVGFPRLCRLVAQDGYLPRPFAIVGRRLVFSVGILYLAGAAAGLLIVFNGITDRLIPLFAIGAFLTFTLSQSGMVVHWRDRARARPERWARYHIVLLINLLGAVATGTATIVILAAKFAEGAWITVLVIPVVLLLLRRIKRYYDFLAEQLRDEQPLTLQRTKPPIVLVVTEEWSRLTDRALNFALRMSPDVVAVHLLSLESPDIQEKETQLRRDWARDVAAPAEAAGLLPPRLVLLRASYRRLHVPILKFVRRLAAKLPDRTFAVVVPELVKRKWWQHFLHSHRAERLRADLLRYGGPDLIVVSMPWYLKEPRYEDAFISEELREAGSVSSAISAKT